MGDLLARLAAWCLEVVSTFGYPGLVFLLVLENLFPPIPSELILPLAGFLTSQGRLAFVWAVVWSTVGSVLGALILYWLGYRLGERRLHGFVRRYGRWLLLDESDVEGGQEWFRRHGGKAVLIGRLAPTIRSIISVPAGLARMPLLPFVAYTTLGSGLWNAVLIGAGWLLGANWELVTSYLSAFGWVVGLAAAIGLAWFVRKRLGGARAGAS